jgi:AcrR family transcriptional regulator
MQSPAPSLRDRLIDAGLAILAEGGMEALTLRRVAARAGVSHAAPAHHFDGLPGLLTAIATRAFDRFSQATEQARDAAGASPAARLRGLCAGYLAFATHHSGLFQLMFNEPSLCRTDPDLQKHSSRAFAILHETCRPLADPAAPERLQIAVWSMVHGYAMLGFHRSTGDRRPFGNIPTMTELLDQLLQGPR